MVIVYTAPKTLTWRSNNRSVQQVPALCLPRTQVPKQKWRLQVRSSWQPKVFTELWENISQLAPQLVWKNLEAGLKSLELEFPREKTSGWNEVASADELPRLWVSISSKSQSQERWSCQEVLLFRTGVTEYLGLGTSGSKSYGKEPDVK